MNRNTFQQRVTPVKPKVLENERVFVYIPTADSGSKGIAAFDNRDFNSPKGQVTLKWPMETIVNLADPTVRPSLIKVTDDEFVKTQNTVRIIHPTSGISYTTNKSEIKLNRENRDAFVRPDLVMLNSQDFDVDRIGNYNKYKIKIKDPFIEAAPVKLDSAQFKRENGLIKINWPYAHDGDYGLVKTVPDGNLVYDEQNRLTVDSSKLIITKEQVGLSNVENRTFASRIYNEFGDEMKAYFTGQFGLKLNTVQWNAFVTQFVTKMSELDMTDEAIRSSIITTQSFLGFFNTAAELPDAEEYKDVRAYVIATNSYWIVTGTGWSDTELSFSNYLEDVETDVENLKPNAIIPSLGSSGRWVNSDHIHPSDPTKASTNYVDEAIENIVTVPVAQSLKNWKDDSREYYWAGNKTEFDALNLADIPNGAIINVTDEELQPGHFVIDDELINKGVNLEADDQFVFMNNGVNLNGLILSMNDNKLSQLEFGTALPTDRIVVSDGNVLSLKTFEGNKMVKTNANGNLETYDLDPTTLINTSGLTSGQVVIASDEKAVETFDAGLIENKPIVSTATGGIKTLTLTGNRIVKTDGAGGLTISEFDENTLIRSTELELELNTVVIVGSDRTIKSWNPGGVEGSMVVMGTNNGTLKLREHDHEFSILLTGPDGTINELGHGEEDQILKSAGAAMPAWVTDNRAEYLPQTILTENPTAEDAANFRGLVAVMLSSEPAEFRDNCIYYY